MCPNLDEDKQGIVLEFTATRFPLIFGWHTLTHTQATVPTRAGARIILSSSSASHELRGQRGLFFYLMWPPQCCLLFPIFVAVRPQINFHPHQFVFSTHTPDQTGVGCRMCPMHYSYLCPLSSVLPWINCRFKAARKRQISWHCFFQTSCGSWEMLLLLVDNVG